MRRARGAVFLLALTLAEAASAGEPLTVFVARHADKPNDQDDALSTLGAARAEALAERLIDEGITEFIASEKRRTQLTAQPLAEASRQLGRMVRRCAANDAAAIVRSIERSRARAILVVTHSDTIGALIERLSGVAKVSEPCACEYDRLYRIEFPSGYAKGRGRLRLETFGALPLGPSGEPCSALAPIDALTCAAHPQSARAPQGRVVESWERCAP